jgi:hypothetical protein
MNAALLRVTACAISAPASAASYYISLRMTDRRHEKLITSGHVHCD